MQRLSQQQTRAAIRRLGIEASMLPAFGLSDPAFGLRYDHHVHSRHQLMMPSVGTLWVETGEHLHVCGAAQAMWIPARCRHATTLGGYPARSIFFSTKNFPSPVRQAVCMTVSPALQALVQAESSDLSELSMAIRQQFYEVLFALVERSLRRPNLPTLVRPKSAGLIKATEYLLAHLDDITIPVLARHAGMSERTLRRRFIEEVNVPPETYLQSARLTRAMRLLESNPRASITEVALHVGYSSHSAFSAAFRRFTNRTPRAFRDSLARK